jgi:hypothetical protein
MTDDDRGLDDIAITELRDAILKQVTSHYSSSHSPPRDRVFEALNALANATAVILKGTNYDQDAHEFFDAALSMSIKGDCDA